MAVTRRFVLAAAALSAAASAIPKAAAATPAAPPAPPPVPKKSWIVGTPGEYNWSLVRARTEKQAMKIWAADNCGGDYEEDEDGNPGPCECTACTQEIATERVEAFDSIPSPTPGDWIRAGIGHTCGRCGYELDPNHGEAYAVGAEALCDDCITAEERAALGIPERPPFDFGPASVREPRAHWPAPAPSGVLEPASPAPNDAPGLTHEPIVDVEIAAEEEAEEPSSNLRFATAPE